MEAGFIRANSSNLPKIDVVMLGAFFESNINSCKVESRKVKTSTSPQASYGDDAINYVQLKRDGKHCIVKCKVCPEQKTKYAVTLIVDEEDDAICSVQCHDCVFCQGNCMHSIAFIMWIHRRSEEPSCPYTKCYWRKPKLPQVGKSLKYVTVKDMFKSSPSLPSNPSVLLKFLEEGRKRKLKNCGLLKHYDYLEDLDIV